MTKEEFEALLLKKGFEKNNPTLLLKIIHIDLYYELFIEADFNDTHVRMAVKTMSLPDNCWVAFLDEYVTYENMTEKKLDEILAQCTKIKTALTTIEHIAKGE